MFGETSYIKLRIYHLEKRIIFIKTLHHKRSMGGVLTHTIIGIVIALIVHFMHYKLEFSLAAFVGNLLPDALKFGITAIKQLTWKIFAVEQDGFYQFLAVHTSNYANWFSLGFFLFGATILLYHYHVIKKKKLFEYDELYVFLLIGIVMHLITDAIVIESNAWI